MIYAPRLGSKLKNTLLISITLRRYKKQPVTGQFRNYQSTDCWSAHMETCAREKGHPEIQRAGTNNESSKNKVDSGSSFNLLQVKTRRSS